MDTPKLVKVSKEVFKDIFNSVKKSITNPTTEAKPLALTDAEQSKAIPKSTDTPKLVKVSKEVFKDFFNSVKKSIKNPATEAKPLPPIRKRIVKKVQMQEM